MPRTALLVVVFVTCVTLPLEAQARTVNQVVPEPPDSVRVPQIAAMRLVELNAELRRKDSVHLRDSLALAAARAANDQLKRTNAAAFNAVLEAKDEMQKLRNDS